MSRAKGGVRRNCHAYEDRVDGRVELDPSVGTEGVEV